MQILDHAIRFLRARDAGLTPSLTKISPGLVSVEIPNFDPVTGERLPDITAQITADQVNADKEELSARIAGLNAKIALMQALITKLDRLLTFME